MKLKAPYSNSTYVYAKPLAYTYFCLKRETISLDRFLVLVTEKRGAKIDPDDITETIFKKLNDAKYLLYLFY